MAMSKFCLRTMANIERPAIAAIWPTLRGESIVLDVGATVGADAQLLIDFTMMGAAMARALFEVEKPTVGLLNIGVEEIKGQEEVKEAGRLIREAAMPSFEYYGFVEGDDWARAPLMWSLPKALSVTLHSRQRKGLPGRSRNICARQCRAL
jgi:glycerol-3-phosphate acyltransferase PlsX